MVVTEELHQTNRFYVIGSHIVAEADHALPALTGKDRNARFEDFSDSKRLLAILKHFCTFKPLKLL